MPDTFKPACERCSTQLPPDSPLARVCSFGCTFCSACVAGPLAQRCPNCRGALERRPVRGALPERSEAPAREGAPPFEPRGLRFEGRWERAGWRLKRYALWHPARGRPGPADWQAAEAVAGAVLDRAAAGGLGFVLLHRGRDGDYLLVDWWTEEVLNQRLLVRPEGEAAFRDPVAASWVACAWELEVLGGERQAWVETAMARPPGAYLDRHLPDREA